MDTSAHEGGVPERSLRDLYYVLFRHRRKTLLFFAAVVVTVAIGTFLSPETYRSEAKLLVRLGRESVSLDPTATTGQIVNIGQSRENEINSEMEILKSRELVEKVVDSFGAAVFLHGTGEEAIAQVPPAGAERVTSRDTASAVRSVAATTMVPTGRQDQADNLRDREKAVLLLVKRLEIEKEKNSNVLSVSYEAKSPKRARDVVDKLIGFFLDKHIVVHRTVGSHQFFTEQTAQIRTALAQAEDELRKIKNEAGVASLEEQRRVLVGRIGGLQQEIEQTDAALAGSGARAKALQRSLAGLPKVQVTEKTSGFPNWAADGMRQKLYDLQLKEQDLLSKFNPENPLVEEVRRQIAEAKAVLDREEPTRTQLTTGLNTAYEKIHLDLMIEKGVFSSLQAKGGVLGRQLAAAGEELKKQNDAELRIAHLKRDVEVQGENYRKYVEKLEQARIDQALETDKISNISVVQPASYPVKPIRPRKALNLALGLLMGVFGGIGFAFASEFTDHTFKTPEDIAERLRMTPLASVPRLPADRISSSVGEALDLLRDRLSLPENGSPGPPKTFAVTSCRQGEGVSFIASGLAEVLSRHVDGRVLLVSGTLRNPTVLGSYGTAGSNAPDSSTEKSGQTCYEVRKVLVADPSEASRQSLARFLREKGMEVIEAADGNKALADAVLNRPDILLLDLSINVIGAERIATMLRANFRTESIPVFFLGEEENAVSGLCRGIDRFLRKPVSPELLLQEILRDQIHEVPMEEETIPPLGDPKVFADQLKRWTGEYKVVVFDMPPVWDPGFSARLASQVDGVILVLEAEKVRWEVARQAKEFLGQTNANLVGAVLNKRQFHIPEWMYKRL